LILEKGITVKFDYFDLISGFFGDNDNDTIGYKLSKIHFPASILQNCGGGLVITAIILIV